MKKYYFLTLFFVLKACFIFAQNPYILKNEGFEIIKNFEILSDKGYTFEQILTDSTLEFKENPNFYKFDKDEYVWIKLAIKNNSAYLKNSYLFLVPHIDNTLYCYDYEKKAWTTTQAGLAINDFQRKPGDFSIRLQSNTINSLYIKAKVNELNTQSYPIDMLVGLQSEESYKDNEQLIIMLWSIVSFTMTLFFIYNLYIYFFFRDKTYLYYLIIVLGAILFITAFSKVFNFIIPFSFYNLQIQSDGDLHSYSTENIISIGFIWMILFGYTQFTRSYLKLNTYLPLWDTILKYSLYILSIFSLGFIIIAFFKSIYIHSLLSLIHNVLIAIIILLLFCVGILSYRNGNKLARFFLLANTFPLLIIMIIAIYLIVYETKIKPVQFLPHIALLSQTVGFAIALVARINLIKDELKEKQLEAQKLEAENNQIQARNRYIELENKHIISEMALEINQKTTLQEKLEANQRELTANTLYLYQKNELLTNLQKQLQNLSYKDTTTQNRKGIKEIKSTLNNDIQLENNWDSFKVHFEKVHPNFFKELNEKYPTLTKYEIRLSAYYHLNMTAKEIATLLNINPSSVHRSKSRLNRKMETIDKKK